MNRRITFDIDILESKTEIKKIEFEHQIEHVAVSTSINSLKTFANIIANFKSAKKLNIDLYIEEERKN